MPDGRTSQCKACAKKRAAARYQRERDQILAKTKAYRQANPEKYAGYSREWRARNPEKVKAANRRLIARYGDEWGKRSVEYDRKYPEKASERRFRRRAAMKNAYVEEVPPDTILKRDLGICGICGGQIMGPFHLDHIVPLAAGGMHEIANVQLAHPSCNHRKWAKVDFTLDAAA